MRDLWQLRAKVQEPASVLRLCLLFMVHLTILFVNPELDREWNELGVGYPDICLEVLRKDMRITSQDGGLQTDIWTLDLLNMKDECCRPDRDIQSLCNNINKLRWRASLEKPVLKRPRISPLFRNTKATTVFTEGSH